MKTTRTSFAKRLPLNLAIMGFVQLAAICFTALLEPHARQLTLGDIILITGIAVTSALVITAGDVYFHLHD